MTKRRFNSKQQNQIEALRDMHATVACLLEDLHAQMGEFMRKTLAVPAIEGFADAIDERVFEPGEAIDAVRTAIDDVDWTLEKIQELVDNARNNLVYYGAKYEQNAPAKRAEE